MSKDQWIADNERVLEDYQDGEISLGEAGDRLIEQGFDQHEVREMLQELEIERIPVGYFGAEKRASRGAK